MRKDSSVFMDDAGRAAMWMNAVREYGTNGTEKKGVYNVLRTTMKDI